MHLPLIFLFQCVTRALTPAVAGHHRWEKYYRILDPRTSNIPLSYQILLAPYLSGTCICTCIAHERSEADISGKYSIIGESHAVCMTK